MFTFSQLLLNLAGVTKPMLLNSLSNVKTTGDLKGISQFRDFARFQLNDKRMETQNRRSRSEMITWNDVDRMKLIVIICFIHSTT